MCADVADQRICIRVTCGNKIVDPGEKCDDGNNRSGDGCPADCSDPCGDGVLDPGEVCDDGNATDGDGCSGDCRALDGSFLVSPDSVAFTANEGEAAPADIIVTVRVRYRDDEIAIGYPQGSSQPPWLSVAQGPVNGNVAQIRFAASAPGAASRQATMVRITARHKSSTAVDSYDVPVSYDVAASDLAIQAAPSSLSFAAIAGGPIPAAQSAAVTFVGPEVAVLGAPSWIQVSGPADPTASPASFAISVNTTSIAAGSTLSGDVTFRTTRGTAHRDATVHAAYRVLAASEVEVQFVAPYIAVAGRPGTLLVRGHRFQALGGPVTLGIGDRVVGPLSADSDTQITLHYPALPEGHYPVKIIDPPGFDLTRAELVVVPPTAMTYQAVDAPGSRSKLIYDAERGAIYGVSSSDQDIEHFVYADGAWSRRSPHVFPQLNDAAMAPDGRSLIMLTDGAINEISLLDGMFVPVRRFGNPDPSCGGFFDHVTTANNGKFFVIFSLRGCSGFTPVYLYDLFDHTLTHTSEFYNAIAGASGDGSRIYVGGNGLSPPEMIHTFDAFSGTLSSSAVEFSLDWVSVSDDASRVILEDTEVYDRSVVITGFLPVLPHSVATLASHDSSRAFMYVDDNTGARIDVYNLNGPLQPGALYPLLKSIPLPDSANATAVHGHVAMTSTPDDAVVFVSGDRRLLVVPVD